VLNPQSVKQLQEGLGQLLPVARAEMESLYEQIAGSGIMLARHGAGVALVEPLLGASMGLPGTVTRPLKPRIDVKTLLIRHKTAPQSKIMNEFIGHLNRTIAAEPTQ